MKKIVLALALLLCGITSQAQLFIDNSYTVEDMINGFFSNSGVTISNITYTGTPSSLAFFEGSQSNIGINAGLILTTGDVAKAIGPNDSESTSTNMGVPGTPWLNALIPGYQTYDAAIIEMDVVPDGDTLSFKYVFASEEYQEFVNTQFNDLFAFLIDGPGLPMGDTIYVAADTILYYDSCYICVDTVLVSQQVYCYYDSLQMIDTCIVYADTLYTWCYQDPNCVPDTTIYPGYFYISPGGTNIAEIPNTNLPVAINNLNQFMNTQYFVDNAGGSSVQYDAFTTPLWAVTQVIPGETYHVRIAIADAGDGVFDSGVFMSIESLGGDSLLSVNPVFLVIPGSGSHNVSFDNNTLWATQWHWDFGDGTTSEERFPEHTYANDGNYTVTLTASNWCSQKSYHQEVKIGVSGVNEPISNVFKVMPNPTNGSFVLDLQRDPSAQVRLMTPDGRLLLDQQVNDGTRIDLNRFGKGLFILQVVSGGQLYNEKVINR